LRQHLAEALAACFQAGTLTSGASPDIQLEVPGNPEHGDFATNLAMLLTRAERKAPRQVAEALVTALGDGGGLWRKIDIAGPGFINFTLARRPGTGDLTTCSAKTCALACCATVRARRVQVEFVSANPTGPLHIGHGRAPRSATRSADCWPRPAGT